MPASLLAKAASLASNHGAESPSETHLFYVVLEQPEVEAFLRSHGFDPDRLLEALGRGLARSSPGAVEVRQVDKSSYAVIRRPGVDAIDGRVSVLAQLPSAHAVDSFDILAACLFDPQSVASSAFRTAAASRDQLVVALAAELDRYRGILFPRSAVVSYQAPLAAPWSRRAAVLEAVNRLGLVDDRWMYVRDDDQLFISCVDGIDMTPIRDAIEALED